MRVGNQFGQILRLCVLTGGLLFSSLVSATSTQGDRFLISFAPNNSQGELLVFVSADLDTTGQLVHPGGTIDFTVPAGDVESITVPSAPFQGQAQNSVSSATALITTNNPVTVYGLNKLSATTDGFLALPEAALGTSYYVVSAPEAARVFSSYQAVVAASQDGTTVTLNLTQSAGSCVANTDCTVQLDAGEAYYIASSSSLTGSRVTADKPIAVFGGAQCANLGAGACDHLTEMLPPTSAWATDFFAVRFRKAIGNGPQHVDELTVLAATDNTVVSIDGQDVATLNAGEFYHADLPASGQSTVMNEGYAISASHPVMVVQYMEAGTYTNLQNQTTSGDPAMIVLPSYQQYLPSYSFATMADGFTFDAVNVAIPTAATSSLRLDGQAVASSEFAPIGSSGFSSAQLRITPGTHTISASQPFGIFIYGANPADSYATAGGFSTASIGDVDTIGPPNGPTIEAVSGGSNESCFPILVKDANGDPLAGIRVDGEMTGANPGTSFAFTGSDGIAEVCFPGTEDGDSDVTVTVGTNNFQGTVTWEGCSTECGVAGQTERAAVAPNPPISLSATGNNTSVIIAFTPGSDGGEPISNYEYSLDGTTYTPFDPADDTSPVTISGLQLGVNYGIRLKAVNSVGSSGPSDPVFITLDGTAPVVDSDGDGVSDNDDQCSNTPAGATVDANGCSAAQLDADGDGVSNDNDDCDNTPQGEDVNASGCSLSQLDSDGDGVSDALDQCAGTASGASVDALGCSLAQLDTDNDGVSDALDQCPATEAGTSVTETGCPVLPVPATSSWSLGAMAILLLLISLVSVRRRIF